MHEIFQIEVHWFVSLVVNSNIYTFKKTLSNRNSGIGKMIIYLIIFLYFLIEME